MGTVCGQKEILRGAIADLVRERGRGAKGWDDCNAALRLVGLRERGEHGLQVGRRSDMENAPLRSILCMAGRQYEPAQQQSAAQDPGGWLLAATVV